MRLPRGGLVEDPYKERAMRRALVLFITPFLLGATLICSAQTGEFNEPWKNPAWAIVIDPYEGNSINWDQLSTDTRVVGIIHRATKGSYRDTKYASRKAEAKRRGYLWGSYHLGRRGDPVVQADFYLDTVRPEADEVMALDIESLDTSVDMSLADARLFMQRIKAKTGRYPVLYGNHSVIREVVRRFGHDDVFSKVPLWYARFKRTVTDFPRCTWDSYTLWQFSSEVNCKTESSTDCLYRVPGTRHDMDINVYNGSIEDLRRNWPFTRT